MPLPKRITLEGIIYHLINRGNNHQVIFKNNEDFDSFLNIIKKFKQKYSFRFYAYCLMSNHIHFILEPTIQETLSKIMQSITLSYNRLYHKKYSSSGHLWQGRFKSMIIQADEYLFECLRYVELNPVRAGIISKPGDYPFSSFRFHAYGENRLGILDEDPCYLSLANTGKDRQKAYRKFFETKQDDKIIQEIRKSIGTGLALAQGQFVEEVIERFKASKPRPAGRPRQKR